MVELGAKENKKIVRSSRLVFGGRAPVTKVAKQMQQAIIGMPWDNSLLEEALRLIPLDLPASSDVPGGMPQYRQTLSMSFFYKFFMTVLGRVASSVSCGDFTTCNNSTTLLLIIFSNYFGLIIISII